MKLRLRIIVIFILSLVLSIIVFILGTWFLIAHGWWSGLSMEDMDKAADIAAEAISQSAGDMDSARQIFGDTQKQYPGMEIELLSQNSGILFSTSDVLKLENMGELIDAMSENGHFSAERWLTAKETRLLNDSCYVIVMVPSKFYRAVSFYINSSNGYGIFGKMLILGFIISLIVSSGFAYLFTRKMSRRFGSLSHSIQRFDVGNLDVRIEDSENDEIGKLASSFNNMAERLKNQIQYEKSLENERRKLVSDISHDLRTPLTSIIDYSESLDNGLFDSEEERGKYVSIIRKKAEYMNRLLSELLELSRLECRQLKPKLINLNIAELSREILIEYLPLFKREGIELKADIPDDPEEILVDRDMLSRVIRNLLDNAVKYGASGKKLDYMLSEEQDRVKIRVRDYGQGIDERNQQRIFDRFYRGDKGRATDGGMGLGLAIADEIVKLHGGSLNVESVVGSGTVFVVELPKYNLNKYKEE
jgi:Signal transduction histidine kinase